MPRAMRKKSESGIYHIMLRGIDRQVIFQDDEDCEKYLQCLEAAKRASGFTLHAYCLMGNHLHLLLQEGTEPLELVFKRVGARYVYWYNWKYKRTGHLFQDRFKSEPVNDDAYFLAVLRYIYQNPVKAGLCRHPGEYPWSSYGEIGGRAWLSDPGKALSMLSKEELLAFLDRPGEEVFLDVDTAGRLNDREALDLIKRVCGLDAASDLAGLPPEQQAKGLQDLHQRRCSIRQLSRLTGLSKGQIERLLK